MCKIIFSPCKEMLAKKGQEQPVLSALTLEIIDKIEHLTEAQLQELFKISPQLAQQVYRDYQQIKLHTALPAYQIYQGLAYRQIKWDKLDLSWADDHFIILSALYGPIQPLTPINPYRLDLTIPLKIEDTSLRSLWKAQVNQLLKKQTIINLASKEFASLIDPLQVRLINIEFYQDKKHNKKAPSAIAKKLRGCLAHHLMVNQSTQASVLENFTAFDYVFTSYDPKSLTYTYQLKKEQSKF